ncbi:MAG: T9SS type A sorting domain-containing protein [Chitinophagales bacterium]
MKKTVYAVRCIFIFSLSVMVTNAFSQKITIIESHSGNTWAVQDSFWKLAATNMGYSATVVPQNTLDSLSNLDSTDVLIVSSGTIILPESRLQTVVNFVKGGRPAYIQSEYLGTYGGDITWDSSMTAVNGNFSWVGTVSGELVPMNVLGTFATTPDSVTTLNYFNYGYAGDTTGFNVHPFLEYGGSYFGFFYSDPTTCFGSAITVSDEDWAWQNYSPELMTNMLYALVQSATHFTEQPASITVYLNSNTSFSIATNLTSVSYHWQVNDGSGWTDISNGGIYSNATTATLTLTNVPEVYNGYQYRCVISAECGDFYSEPATLTVDNTLGIDNPGNLVTSVFPNPFIDEFAIRFNRAGKYSLTLSNSLGETIISKTETINASNEELIFPVNNLSSGIYSLTISDGKNSVRKLIECLGEK